MNVSTYGRWTIERLTDPNIQPVEVWNEPFDAGPTGVPGTLLYQAIGAQRLDALRAQCPSARDAAEMLGADIAVALRQLVARLTPAHGPVAAVWLGGGLLNSEGIRDTVLRADLPFPVLLSDDPTFCAAPGGKELLSKHGEGRGIVLDVGQTSIKGTAHSKGRARQLVFPRDHHSLPLHLQERDPRPTSDQVHVFVERAAGFVARAVHGLVAVREPPPPLLVLALPAALSDDGTPQACTYPGWEGCSELIPRIAAQLDEWIQGDHGHPWRNAQGRILLLNDAELAARSARTHSAVAAAGTTLVMTLGFGPGAALLRPTHE